MMNFSNLPAFTATKINIYYKQIFAILYAYFTISGLDGYFLISYTIVFLNLHLSPEAGSQKNKQTKNKDTQQER